MRVSRVCEEACQACRATVLQCAQQSNLRVIHFLQIMTLLSPAFALSLSLFLYTHFEVIAQIRVSACALSLQRSFLLIHLLFSFGPRCNYSNGHVDSFYRVVRVFFFLQGRTHRTDPETHGNIGSCCVVRYERNASAAGVCLACVWEKAWWWRNKGLLRDLCSPDKEMEEIRQSHQDKIAKEGARQRQRESEPIYFVYCMCLAGWCAPLNPESKFCRKKKLSSSLENVHKGLAFFTQQKIRADKSETQHIIYC